MAALTPRTPFGRILHLAVAVLLAASFLHCAPPPPQVYAVFVGGEMVTDAGGQVEVVRGGVASPARRGFEVQAGDTVRTGADGRAVLLLEDGAVEVTVFENSEVVLGSIFAKIGKVVVRVVKKVKDRFEVESDYGVATPETTEFLVAVGAEGQYRCAVLEGRVRVRSPTGEWTSVTLKRGEEATGRPGRAVEARELSVREYNALVDEVNEVARARGTRGERLVPTVTGMPEAEAVRTLRSAGLEAEAVPGLNDRVPVGTVYEQDPGAGSRMSSGRRVRLTVAAEAVRVPALEGLHEREAVSRLREVGLEARTESELEEGADDGTVLAQRPEPGTEVPVGDTVDLTVAERGVRVPRLTGSTRRQFASVLEREGLELGRVSERQESRRPGTVVDQDPRAGELVRPGTRVDVVVAASCTVPDVSEMTRDAALRAIERAGLTGRVEHVGQYVSDSVSRQTPDPGTRVQCGSVVSLRLGTDIG